jgi:class 3 adenylate cyclase
MNDARRRTERIVTATLLLCSLLLAAAAIDHAWGRVGHTSPGFSVMENLLVAVGGVERNSALRPFDRVVALNGHALTSGREIAAAAAAQPRGTPLHYTVARGSETIELDIPTTIVKLAWFKRFVIEAVTPALLFLCLGGIVMYLKPGAGESRVFFAFCLISFVTNLLYPDLHTTYHFTTLFLAVWALTPTALAHLALRFPERRRILRRYPRLPQTLWITGAATAVALLVDFFWQPFHAGYALVVPTFVGSCWSLALIALILSLVRTAWAGSTPLARARAKLLAAGFAVSFLFPVLGTVSEIVFRVSVPYLSEGWRLNLVFPLVVAYAIVRYNLFDMGTVLRLGAIYSGVTLLVALFYAVSLTALNVSFATLEMSVSPVVPAGLVSILIVVLLNPLYLRTQSFVDRVFFRQRYDAQQTVERLASAMTTVLDLRRIVGLIGRTVGELFHPAGATLLLAEDGAPGFRSLEGAGPSVRVNEESPLWSFLRHHRGPLSRERLLEDPTIVSRRDEYRLAMDQLGAELVVPIVFQDRVTALLVLGPKRAGTAYSTEDLRLLRLLLNQSAVALANATAYTALQAALRRVEMLESIKANLSKFVPRTVQSLIEEAPESPALAKRDVDLSVLFVDIAGYARLSERFDTVRVNRLVERYFGAFLDEIVKYGGDVNETAGDGIMVLFQDPDPRAHAGAAVLTACAIVRRAREINAEANGFEEPITLHVGVNSGVAALGATKIEGTTGTRWTYTASGPVTNLAARLATVGEDDSVHIGPETCRRLGPDFLIEDVGEQRLKNLEEPVRVFRVQEREAESPPWPLTVTVSA